MNAEKDVYALLENLEIAWASGGPCRHCHDAVVARER
jgi:hypothetical protein